MNQRLVHHLVEIYLNALELLGTGLQVIEGLPERSRVRNRLQAACMDAVAISRSFPDEPGPTEIGAKVELVLDCFRDAEALLRDLRVNRRSSQPHVSAGIEIAERGAEAALAGARALENEVDRR